MGDDLVMWTIYDHPTDHPDHFVVRSWALRADRASPREALLAPTLTAARALVPGGLYCLPRDPLDDAKVIETWI